MSHPGKKLITSVFIYFSAPGQAPLDPNNPNNDMEFSGAGNKG